MSVKPAARSIKKSSPLKDGPRTKTNKGAGPLDHLFSPAPKKAKKAAAKIEEKVSLAEAVPTKNKAGRFYDITFLWGTVSCTLLPRVRGRQPCFLAHGQRPIGRTPDIPLQRRRLPMPVAAG